VLLLCSDGLWNYLPGAEQLAAALPPPERGTSPVEVARLLTQIALDAGGRDNITVIVIPVPTPAEVRT
jgi:serine/threonine protein phosphatase PrpC